jgi:hypothetical protein
MRAWLVLAFAVALSGCDSEELVVLVQTTGDKPIAGATVACSCEPDASAGAVTADDGIARLVLFSTAHEPCVVTAFASGFTTVQVAEVNPCSGESTCPAIDLEVELEEVRR